MNVVTVKTGDKIKLNLFLSRPHDCGYLPGYQSSTMFVDPSIPMHDTLYAYLMERGFRRSGNHVYRPHCESCRACKAVRLPVHDFTPSRSLRRVGRRNQDLSTKVMPASITQEQFTLYKNYINSRHGEGPMGNPKFEDLTEFLLASWSTTRFVEFRLDNRLLMVAVIDILPEATSAVYTFFDPEEIARSLGTFAILWQIQESKKTDKRHLYLGYWIDNCRKMHYKSRFQPLETCQGKNWVPLKHQWGKRETNADG